jgi:hypothetical protein
VSHAGLQSQKLTNAALTAYCGNQMNQPTLEDRVFRATDAKQLLGNKLFQEAFSAVANHLNMAALSCDPDNATKAQRIIVSQQLLAAVKREITRVVEDGTLAEIQIAELERKSRLERIFRR